MLGRSPPVAPPATTGIAAAATHTSGGTALGDGTAVLVAMAGDIAGVGGVVPGGGGAFLFRPSPSRPLVLPALPSESPSWWWVGAAEMMAARPGRRSPLSLPASTSLSSLSLNDLVHTVVPPRAHSYSGIKQLWLLSQLCIEVRTQALDGKRTARDVLFAQVLRRARQSCKAFVKGVHLVRLDDHEVIIVN